MVKGTDYTLKTFSEESLYDTNFSRETVMHKGLGSCIPVDKDPMLRLLDSDMQTVPDCNCREAIRNVLFGFKQYKMEVISRPVTARKKSLTCSIDHSKYIYPGGVPAHCNGFLLSE